MISVKNLTFNLGKFRLGELSVEVANGQYFVLMGPPGSGKTVFLECLCGLKRITSGQIYIDGRNVALLEPRQRGIGYVPQDYALFPHLSVEGNIGFGLCSLGFSRKEISKKVSEYARVIGIGHLLGRDVMSLSGGEKQRVALARALVVEPKVLLLDEPVCALDESTRQNICAFLRRIQRQLGLTIIHVSHNVEEAFAVADRAAILNEGSLQQVGTLNELLRKPDNEFVAGFMRCENIFCAEVVKQDTENCRTLVKLRGVRFYVPGLYDGRVRFMIRPEDVLVFTGGQHKERKENEFDVNLVCWRDYSSYVRVELNGNINFVAHLTHAGFAELDSDENKNFKVLLRLDNIHVFEDQGGLVQDG